MLHLGTSALEYLYILLKETNLGKIRVREIIVYTNIAIATNNFL